tara:strand:- start:2373 stop:3038 length:666 start_codon:yes stop_codon:yes gene_type:complete
MFTGLVQSVGQLSKYKSGLLVKGVAPFSPLGIGDSISVDGVCLTVSEIIEDGFFADLSEESLSRTTLAKKSQAGGFVNLEPALRLSDRLGGHLVSGHIDCLGKVDKITQLQASWKLEISWTEEKYAKYVCEKASICIDGVSLTIAGCSNLGKSFWIAVIPHTWSSTTLCHLTKGSFVNLEADLLAKYTETLLANQDIKATIKKTIPSEAISKEWLTENGWN